MKVSKQRLIEIINEEIIKEQEQINRTGLDSSKSDASTKFDIKSTADRIGRSGDITNNEINIVGKMMDLLEIASVELDIDKGDAYTILNKAYKLIATVVQNNREQQNEQ